ncbi:MAG: HAMP domain-containing histidine kinase [Elusimicrobia bacterium]|nr:HAMP domain-containing histidine kinase [Elusimicrobiota bacterium]
MTLRVRFTILIGLLLLFGIGLTGAAIYVGERRVLLREMAQGRQALLTAFAQSCRDALATHDHLQAMNAAESLTRSAGVISAYGIDDQGRVFAHNDVTRVGKAPSPIPVGEIVLITPLSQIKNKRGQAVIVFSRKIIERAEQESVRQTARRIAGVTAVLLFLGLFFSAAMARSISRPIQRIADATRQLAQNKLDHRIPEDRSDELGRLAEDFNQMAERLGELDKMKNDFVSMVTHELRSPLSAIETYASLIADEWRNGESAELVDHLTTIRNNATRLGRFVNNILDVAKIEAKAMEIRKEPVSVALAFKDQVDLFYAKAKEKNVGITVVPSRDELTVSADPDKLAQILTNLVGNALKFTPSGGGIRISSEAGVVLAGRPHVRLSVADTGPGIAAKDRERIFNRFEQVAEIRDKIKGQKGTGLGLAITKSLVELQGGTITVESEVGRGSVFSVYLPEET